MDFQIKFLGRILKSGLVVTTLFALIFGGLFLKLKNAGATGDSNPPSFPSCSTQSGAGDKAHYESGNHQIPGNGLLEGQDDVYTLSDGNYLQCFRNDEVCIQSNWWRTDQQKEGWFSLNGEQWNLGNFHYLVQNVNCEPEPSPSPSPSPIPSPVPSPAPQGGQDQGQSQEQNQDVNVDVDVEQKQENNQTVNITVPEVKAAVTSVPAKQPETGVGVLGMASMAGVGPLGLLLARYGRGRIVGKKDEENLSEIGFNLTEERRDKNLS